MVNGSISDPGLNDLGINSIKQLGGRKDAKAHWEIAIFLLLQGQRNSANLHWGKWGMANGEFGGNLSTDCTRTTNSGSKIAFHACDNSFYVGHECAPSLRQRYKMVIATEDFKSDLLFIFADLAADGWLRDVQPLSGFAEVQVASDSKHVLELPKRWGKIHGDRLRGTSACLDWTLARRKSRVSSFFQARARVPGALLGVAILLGK
jgi:hypothetical protein